MIYTRLDNVEFNMQFATLFGGSMYGHSYFSHPRPRKGFTSYVCIKNCQIVGLLTVTKSRSGMTIWSNGTIVRPAYLRQGIAKSLWAKMIKTERPTRISVSLASDRGLSLIDFVKTRFPDIKWRVTEMANRKLRKLNG